MAVESTGSNFRTLFIDDGDVASRIGTIRVIHPAKKYDGNPIVVSDRLWEGKHVHIGTVRKEGDNYRMWYESGRKEPRTRIHMYADSADGVHWSKPALRQVKDFEGGLDNNICIDMDRADHNHSVLHTPHMGGENEYSLLSYGPERPEHRASDGYYMMFSPDGLHWKDAQPKPVIPGHQDVGWFMYDQVDDEWRGIVKTFLITMNKKRRSVMCTISKDGYNWSLPHPAVLPDPQDDEWADGNPDHYTQFYGMPITRYESMILGFLEVFKCTDGVASFDGTTDVQLVSSRNGRDWERVGDRSPIIERGPEGAFDWGVVQMGNSLVPDGDMVRVYYDGSNRRHGKDGGERAIGLASWQRDRFVSLRAGSCLGEIQLIPRRVAGALHINVNADGGSLVAELADEAGRLIPGFEASNCLPLEQDSLDHELHWANGATTASLEGRLVQLTLRFMRADVFSLWWQPESGRDLV